jgi:signal transduction histidine kinase
VAAGGAAVWLTLEHQGPFASVASPHVAALAAQLFVGMTVVVGLFLAMSRLENTLLTADVQAARDESDRRAELLRTIIMSMHDAVVVVDAEDRVALANRAAARTVLAATDSPVGTPMREVPLSRPDGSPIPPEEQPSRPALGGRVHRADVHLAGQRDAVTHRVTATPLPGHDGTVSGAVLVFHDISDERAQQEALSSFASTVAHDLLNPISAISAWSELLRERLQGMPEELATLTRIERSTDRMHALVNDLLADARAREFTLRSEVVDLTELARDAARAVPGAVVEVERIPPVLGDPMLLQQVLVNLVGNAVKYAAPHRDPQICVSGSRDALGDVVVRVSDRGIGIPADHLESVFEAFRRVPGTDRQGTGLGLAICQRIVERHGGRIVARQRDDGPGTVMEMTLPAAPDDERGAA